MAIAIEAPLTGIIHTNTWGVYTMPYGDFFYRHPTLPSTKQVTLLGNIPSAVEKYSPLDISKQAEMVRMQFPLLLESNRGINPVDYKNTL